MQKSKNCNQGTLFKTCMHFSREIKEVKDACILSLQFSKITKPITTSLVKNEYENKCTGSLISLLSSSEKFQNYCVSSQTKQTIWCFFSVTLWNFCISTRNSPPTHSPALEVFLCILCKLVWVRLSLGIIKNFNKMPRLDRRNDTQIH